MKLDLIKFYLDYLNDWLTVEAYANHWGLSIEHCSSLLAIGRQLHIESTEG